MAQSNAYKLAEKIYFDGSQMRRDIGFHGIEKIGDSANKE
jgi:phosphoribosylamine-glycine ligase